MSEPIPSEGSNKGGDDSGADISRALSRNVSLSHSKRLGMQKKIDTEKMFKNKIRKIVEGNAVTIIMSIVTLYALIGVSTNYNFLNRNSL